MSLSKTFPTFSLLGGRDLRGTLALALILRFDFSGAVHHACRETITDGRQNLISKRDIMALTWSWSSTSLYYISLSLGFGYTNHLVGQSTSHGLGTIEPFDYSKGRLTNCACC